jgi:multidrug resistance efflux pump
MKRFAVWTFLFVLFASLGFGATLLASEGGDLVARLNESDTTTVGTLSSTNAPAPAEEAQEAPAPLTAVGQVEVGQERQVVFAASGRVTEILVDVGDTVQADELLMALDTIYLDWAVEQAEIAFETARIDFEELGESIEESDIAVAEANLLLAQEQLTETAAGPSDSEIAAAESSVAAAQAAYEELQEQPTQAQINQALAALRLAEIGVQAAQREYDKIAWLPEAAATEAADNLQRATIDLEAAKAAFDEANKPATEAELQAALSTIQQAQHALNELVKQPTPAQLAEAEAGVATAEDALEEIQQGPKESDLRKAELAVRDAMIALEQARLAQANAEVRAPISGTILSVDVELGQEVAAGDIAATMADTSDIRLVVNVEQKDISRVSIGQGVDISIYALPTDAFVGVVSRIAPVAESGTGFVTFPVIIQFVEGPLEKVLPGMTASAVFRTDGEAPPAPASGAQPTVAPTATPAAQPTAEPTEEPTVEPTAESSGDSSGG